VASERELCCGSAGIYNLVAPEAAAELGARKARHLLDTGAQLIAAGNPGCAAQLDMHLRQLGQPIPIQHPIELLWRSLSTAQVRAERAA
jgi:glycolate oxidase iron-sulfur subunit